MSEPLAQMLERLAALEAKATPGPWATDYGDDEYCSSMSGILSVAEQERIQADTRQHRGDFPEDTRWIVVDPGCAPVRHAEEIDANWELIAALRNAAPRLLELVRAGEALAEAAREAYGESIPLGIRYCGTERANRLHAGLRDALAAWDREASRGARAKEGE